MEGQARQFPLVLRMNHTSDMNKTQQEQHREKAEFCFRRERSNTHNVSVFLLRHLGKVRIWGQKKKKKKLLSVHPVLVLTAF